VSTATGERQEGKHRETELATPSKQRLGACPPYLRLSLYVSKGLVCIGISMNSPGILLSLNGPS
jgi:hypothetical protein